MTEASGQFGDNPFAKLNLKDFPKRRGKPENISNHASIDYKDQQLFLSAFEKLPIKNPPRTSGFPLTEQCNLSACSEMTKKNTPKKVAKTLPSAPKSPVKSVEIREQNEFELAMRSVQPLSGQGRRVAQKPLLRSAILPREQTLEDFMAGRLEFEISSTDEYLEGHVTGLDELILNRLRAGQFSPEANLDLHGLNSEQAFETLKEFMRQSWLKNLRVVLIVTGRGHNSPQGQSVLRHKLQGWLTREPFKRVVLGFCTARPHDGGPGSIYVLLRRFRKKGRIQWDRFYIDPD